MKRISEFIPNQKRCRELENRIKKVHKLIYKVPLYKVQKAIALERRLRKEWEMAKEMMVREIAKRG